jgi:alpha-1,2-mannosyltransferase
VQTGQEIEVSLSSETTPLSDPRSDWAWLRWWLFPAALVASLYGWAVLISTFIHPGSIGINHIAPGTDWMVFYGAVKSALSGHLSLIMNGDDFTAYLNRSFGDWLSVPLEFRPWFYPPSFLVLLLPFAPLGLVGSYVAFQLTTGGLLAAALDNGGRDAAVSRYVIAAVLISPAASNNIVDGQCAFLIGALMVSGVRLIEARPILAGVLLGLLSFKPQFFLLVPFVLLALNQWRSLIAAVCSALALVLLSALIFGIDLWTWWVPQAVANLTSPDPKWVAYGRIWGHSVWACAVLLGFPDRLASLLQLSALAGGAAATFIAFRSSLANDKKLCILLAASVLAAPHSGPYDALLLVVAVALWLAGEAGTPNRLHWLLGFGIWLVPLMSPPAYVVAGRFAPLLTVILIGLILSELRHAKPQQARAIA